MRVLNDFQCSQCGVLQIDRYVDNEESTVDCLHCNHYATKVQRVPNFTLPGNGQGFPSADDKWVKMREQKIALEKKQEE
jgi:hypothetical protein